MLEKKSEQVEIFFLYTAAELQCKNKRSEWTSKDLNVFIDSQHLQNIMLKKTKPFS